MEILICFLYITIRLVDSRNFLFITSVTKLAKIVEITHLVPLSSKRASSSRKMLF